MTVKECYEKIGGNYTEALGRFRSDSNIVKFFALYMNDTSIDDMKTAFYAQDYESAFRSTHTLKGVLRNMAFTDLADLVTVITEFLRGSSDIPAAIRMFPIVVAKAQATKETISEFLAERDI